MVGLGSVGGKLNEIKELEQVLPNSTERGLGI
jgi:hypothetical protein